MSKKTISIRLEEKEENFMKNYESMHNFGDDENESISDKIRSILNNYELLLSCAIHDNSTKFTVSECCLIVDICNSWLYTPQGHPAASLSLNINDSDLYEGTGAKWKVDINSLVKKVSEMSALDAFSLIYCARTFWNNNEKVKDLGIEEAVRRIFRLA